MNQTSLDPTMDMKAEFDNIAPYAELYLSAFDDLKKGMNTDLKTVVTGTTVTDVKYLMSFYNISHVPVVDHEGNAVGLIHKNKMRKEVARIRKFLEIAPRELDSLLLCEEVMQIDFSEATPDTLIKDAMDQMIFEKSDCLLVKNKQNRLVGIITKSDITKYLYFNDEDFFIPSVE